MKLFFKILCCFFWIQITFAQTLTPLSSVKFEVGCEGEEYCELPTKVKIEGGISINGSDYLSNATPVQDGNVKGLLYLPSTTDNLDIFFRVKPAPEDIGQPVEVGVIVTYADMGSVMTMALLGNGFKPKLYFYMLNEQNTVLFLPEAWNGKDVVPFRKFTAAENHDVHAYQGQLNAPGFFGITFLYRLANGDYVVTKDTVTLLILEGNSFFSSFL